MRSPQFLPFPCLGGPFPVLSLGEPAALNVSASIRHNSFNGRIFYDRWASGMPCEPMSIQRLVCPMRIRHQVLQSHCTEEQVLQRSPVRRGAVRHTMGAGSWRMNRPDAMNEEDIPLPSIVELCGSRPSDARITTGCRTTKRPSGEATPHPARDKYSQHAVSQSVRRGRSYEAAVTLSVAKDPAVRKVNSATNAGAAPRLVPGRLHVTCFRRAQSILRRRRR
jgi:hypothetical protein